MIERSLSENIRKRINSGKAIVVIGTRQTGTTLLKSTLLFVKELNIHITIIFSLINIFGEHMLNKK